MAHTEYRACRSTTVYKVGVVPTKYRVCEACIEVARQSATAYKVGMAGIGYQSS